MTSCEKGLCLTPNEVQEMFCYQCQETAQGKGCQRVGVCGKRPEVARAQDLLLFIVKGIGLLADKCRCQDGTCSAGRAEVHAFVNDALFSTITNANFDRESIDQRIDRALMIRNKLVSQCRARGMELSCCDALWWDGARSEYDLKASHVGVMSEADEEIRSLKELTLYGLKGMAAYMEHAARLGLHDAAISDFMLYALGQLLVCRNADALTTLVFKTGEWGVKAMELLDRANTQAFGDPEPTEVNLGVGSRPGILVSGHDLRDLKQLLEQSQSSDIDIYTHCEMLPAHYYPNLRKYKHLRGNYGNAWWRQREEMESFNGPVLFTSNCIVPPTERQHYQNRAFTTGSAGFPGWPHIEADKEGRKDFSRLIALAKTCKSPTPLESGTLAGGFAHKQLFELTDAVTDAMRKKLIRKVVVMAGCDGRMNSRQYYTDFASHLPKDCVILTAGCAKYRYNKLGLGQIAGIPRVIDAGQCNDSYSLALFALRLKEVFGLDDVNELPIVYNIAWYEQKAVIVLLSLLSLGVKHIHLGPTLPAFLSPGVARLLTERFGIGTITTPEADMKRFGLV